MKVQLKKNPVSLKTVQKISLKTLKTDMLASQRTLCSTTCNSVSEKRSLKSLVTVNKPKTVSVSNYLNTEYDDIRAMCPKKQTTFLSNLFCSLQGNRQQYGCQCEPNCYWMNYWLSLCYNIAFPRKTVKMDKKVDSQICKDISRTQPNQPEFTTSQYQNVLYECLKEYAETDQEIGYIQGMNIICSVLVYHGDNLLNCQHILQFLMRSCELRNIYLNNFQLAHQLTQKLVYFLKFRCNDIYMHLIVKMQINLIPFVIGWLLPLLGNIVPLKYMHLVVNTFIEKGWNGVLKIIMALLIFLKSQILSTFDETQLMLMLSTHKLKATALNWQQIIKSANNINIRQLPQTF